MSHIIIKLFTLFTISSLFVIPIYADEFALSKEELVKQIILQKEHINILSKKVYDLEDLVLLMANKFKDIDRAFQIISKRVQEAEIVSIATLVSLTLVSSLAILAMKERVAWSY